MFWKYRTEDKNTKYRKTQIEYNSEVKKQTTQSTTKQKPSWFSRLLRHSARKRDGFILYNAPEHTVHTGLWAHEAWEGLYHSTTYYRDKKTKSERKEIV